MEPRIVVDTSIIIKWLNQTNESHIDKADNIMEAVINGEIDMYAPELAKYEIGNALLTSKKLSPQEAYISLGTAYSLPINFIAETEEQARETYKIAWDLSITYYDASFLSLTKQYDAVLITENTKHQGKSKNIKVKSLQDV